jgi:hypothetical protein
MLEESSFANRRADYVWLLLLSSLMLLVSLQQPSPTSLANRISPGAIASVQPSVPLFFSRLRSNLCVVQTTPVNPRSAFWYLCHLRALFASGPCCALVGYQWYMEGCYGRLDWVCCGPRWMVLEGCMGEGNGWRLYPPHRGSRCAVSILCFGVPSFDSDNLSRKRLLGDV